jgi:hypothetical protein
MIEKMIDSLSHGVPRASCSEVITLGRTAEEAEPPT